MPVFIVVKIRIVLIYVVDTYVHHVQYIKKQLGDYLDNL